MRVQLCGAGNFGPGGQCQSCPKGTYKTFSGPGNCTKCPGNTYSNENGAVSNETCLPCPEFYGSSEGSQDLSSCKCRPGRGSSDCLPCEYPLVKGGWGPQNCTVCPQNSVYKSPSECMCVPGYTGSWGVSFRLGHSFDHMYTCMHAMAWHKSFASLTALTNQTWEHDLLLTVARSRANNAPKVPGNPPTAVRDAASALRTTTRQPRAQQATQRAWRARHTRGQLRGRHRCRTARARRDAQAPSACRARRACTRTPRASSPAHCAPTPQSPSTPPTASAARAIREHTT
jgi:hypothetical protein